MSITIPPPGRRISSRWLVVCRPSSSSARISPVDIRSLPAKRLTSVDLPTPLEPSSTAVTPGAIRARSSSQPSPVFALTTCTGTPCAAASTSATKAERSSKRSAFVSTISGLAPLSQIVTR